MDGLGLRERRQADEERDATLQRQQGFIICLHRSVESVFFSALSSVWIVFNGKNLFSPIHSIGLSQFTN